MDGTRVRLTLETGNKFGHFSESEHDTVSICIFFRETGELREIKFSHQEFFKKLFGTRRWFKDNRLIVDEVILTSKK
jgi:hypothetical protein